MARLQDMVRVLRSKNAGPFAITFDIMFKSPGEFERALRAGVFTPARLEGVLKYPRADIAVFPFPPALAVKVVVPRRYSSGSVDDTDVFGCQQHAPLLDIEVP